MTLNELNSRKALILSEAVAALKRLVLDAAAAIEKETAQVSLSFDVPDGRVDISSGRAQVALNGGGEVSIGQYLQILEAQAKSEGIAFAKAAEAPVVAVVAAAEHAEAEVAAEVQAVEAEAETGFQKLFSR